jgi:hypothetical protein
MRSEKLFSILVLAGSALAASLPACSSSDPDPNKDGGGTDSGGIKDSGGAKDTGVGAEFW